MPKKPCFKVQKKALIRWKAGVMGKAWYCFNLILVDIMATEPTEKHGKKQYPLNNIFASFREFRGFRGY
jgi:hypothetical protein